MSFSNFIKRLPTNTSRFHRTQFYVNNYIQNNNGDWKKYWNCKQNNNFKLGNAKLIKKAGCDEIILPMPKESLCNVSITTWHGNSEPTIIFYSGAYCIGALDGNIEITNCEKYPKDFKEKGIYCNQGRISRIICKEPAVTLNIFYSQPSLTLSDAYDFIKWWYMQKLDK